MRFVPRLAVILGSPGRRTFVAASAGCWSLEVRFGVASTHDDGSRFRIVAHFRPSICF